MKDKFLNALIVFIMIIIMGLGGLYYVKIIQSHNYPLANVIGFGDVVDEEQDAVTTTTDTTQETEKSNEPEDRMTISNNDEEIENTPVNVYVNPNQKGYKYNNRYYYNGLDTYSKAIYDSIIRDMDKLKTGTHRIEIDYDFRILLNGTNGEEELKKYYDDAVNALNLDVPNLFYIDFSKMYLTIETTSTVFSTKYKLYIDPEKNPNYFADGFTSQQEVEFAINQVETVKKQIKSSVQGSDYTKLKEVHDWLINNMEYDLHANQRASVYGALIENKGVCEAYARAYKYIIDELGIGNVLVTGTGTNSTGTTEDHMWNYVQLNGNWYAVDVTWDDPIVIGGGTLNDEIRHKYFLLGSSDLFRNHTEKLTISKSGKIFTPPKLMVNKY